MKLGRLTCLTTFVLSLSRCLPCMASRPGSGWLLCPYSSIKRRALGSETLSPLISDIFSLLVPPPLSHRRGCRNLPVSLDVRNCVCSRRTTDGNRRGGELGRYALPVLQVTVKTFVGDEAYRRGSANKHRRHPAAASCLQSTNLIPSITSDRSQLTKNYQQVCCMHHDCRVTSDTSNCYSS